MTATPPFRFADRLGHLPGYPLAHLPRRKRELSAAGLDVIDLGAGDADLAPPDIAVAELAAAARDPAMSRYGWQLGLVRFREAIARYHARRFDTALDPMTEVLPLVGSKEGLAHFALALAGPGDVVIVPEPGYVCYLGGTVCAGAEAHVVPLTPRTEFLLELEEVPVDVLRRARLVFLNYPNNPTAAVAPHEYLERTVAVCRRHGIVLAYDNPYVELTFDGYRAPSIFEVPGAREVAVEFHSCSKSFSMTGWRIAWAAGRPELIAALSRVKSFYDTGAFLAVQAAAAATLDRAESLVAPVVAAFQARRDAAVAALRHAGFDVEPPRGTMYLWVPLPEGVASAAFAEQAMEEQGVIVLPGTSFGPSAEGFFRLALTAPEHRLDEAAVRLGKVLARA